MALTGDIKLVRYGTTDGHQPLAAPMGANVTVYRGGVALLDSSGNLKNGATPAATDTVIGMIDQVAGGTAAETGPGIVNGATIGAVYCDCATGSFLFTSGTAGDALTEANAGTTVYYGGEGTGTVIAAATNGGSTRPVLGTMLPLDPTIPSGMVAVKLVGPAGGGA